MQTTITKQTKVTKQAAKALKVQAPRESGSIRFSLEPMTGRPSAGSKLFAHTAAFMLVSGLLEGKPVSRTVARQVIGDTAISYHAKRGNFEKTADGLMLTAKGETYFAERDADLEAVEAYAAFFVTGKVSEGMQRVNNEAFILPVKA